jgi:hypothetical protein
VNGKIDNMIVLFLLSKFADSTLKTWRSWVLLYTDFCRETSLIYPHNPPSPPPHTHTTTTTTHYLLHLYRRPVTEPCLFHTCLHIVLELSFPIHVPRSEWSWSNLCASEWVVWKSTPSFVHPVLVGLLRSTWHSTWSGQYTVDHLDQVCRTLWLPLFLPQ